MKYIKQQAELSLLIALEDVMPPGKPGRIKGLVKRLKKQAWKELKKLPMLDKDQVAMAHERVKAFEDISCWRGKKKHILSYVSFVSAVIDGHGYNAIEETLTEIVDFFERKSPVPQACYWSGDVAKDKWEGVWK